MNANAKTTVPLSYFGDEILLYTTISKSRLWPESCVKNLEHEARAKQTQFLRCVYHAQSLNLNSDSGSSEESSVCNWAYTRRKRQRSIHFVRRELSRLVLQCWRSLHWIESWIQPVWLGSVVETNLIATFKQTWTWKFNGHRGREAWIPRLVSLRFGILFGFFSCLYIIIEN